MLKYQSVLAAAAGALLLVPTFATQEQGIGGLERSLEETIRALEALAGIQRGVEQSAPNAVALVLQATEPTQEDAKARDAQLVTLRDEVNRLQGVADRMASPAVQPEVLADLLQAQPEQAKRLSVSTGLSTQDRGALAVGASGTNMNTAVIESAPAATVYTEADTIRQAQTLYKSGRYADCVVFLDGKNADLEAVWWRARALEQLKRWPEAIDGYKQASGSKEPVLARRAKQDLEFLQWKRDYQLKKNTNSQKDSQ
jgi:hypothetical protein